MATFIKNSDGCTLIIGFSEERKDTQVAITYEDALGQTQIVSIHLDKIELKNFQFMVNRQMDLVNHLEIMNRN